MEVILVLDIDQYEEYESLIDKGWCDVAYKKVYLPTVFIGLGLSIGFIDSKGEEHETQFVVIGARYLFKCRLLEVYIKFDESPFLMAEMVTEENGWSKRSVFIS